MLLEKNQSQNSSICFKTSGLSFSQSDFQICCGLNAVDNPRNVELCFQSMQGFGLSFARMGAYKPRTSPYSFQGHGADCLNYVFSLAANYEIKLIAMEVTHERQIQEINNALAKVENAPAIMLQIGTRNAQNFELLSAVGSQNRHSILYKRGYGISLHESILAAEYIAKAGNKNIVFCLRGMKSEFGAPHRNMVDFAHVPVVKRLTRMPVCIDPSHAVGSTVAGNDAISDLAHACAQGIIAGANMLLIDIHPQPAKALVDPKQAISLQQLGWLLDDIEITRRAYDARVINASQFQHTMV